MTEEAREAAWQDAHDAWTLESGEPMSRDDERLSDSFFAAGVAEGIRQAKEAIGGWGQSPPALWRETLDALESEK